MRAAQKRIQEAIGILEALDLPNEQRNERTAICLLALLDLTLQKPWSEASAPMLGIRGVLDFARERYQKPYAENTRETVRDESIKPLVAAGALLHNPDDPVRPVNSPKNCYQIEPALLKVLKGFGSGAWAGELARYLSTRQSLVERYAKVRDLTRIPLRVKEGVHVNLSSGAHSTLIKSVITEFASRFVPGGDLIYVGDTGSKWGYFDRDLLESLGVSVGTHGKMPDVVIYHREKHWLILVEAVASSGPVDGRRHAELSEIFKASKAGIVYVTAFPDRGELFRKFLTVIAWETEVWCADASAHLIHFNGVRFLGPYGTAGKP